MSGFVWERRILMEFGDTSDVRRLVLKKSQWGRRLQIKGHFHLVAAMSQLWVVVTSGGIHF